MHIEVLCTGDELLTGLTVDTNSPFFMERLLRLGERVRRARVVGDDRGEITRALRELSREADAVLVSGGLGPTADDLTAECAAEAAGVPLVENAAVLAHLRERFARRQMTLTPNNQKQAQVPSGAEVIVSPVGSAPMFILDIGRCTFFFVAGVPREYRHLVEHEVLPRLRQRLERAPDRVHRAFTLLRTVGLPESQLDAKVAEFSARHPRVQFGFRTQAPENHLKLLAEAETQAQAEAALDAARAESLAALAPYVFGEGEADLSLVVARTLRDAGATVAVAESCTGGLLSEMLTRHGGASQFFLGGAVVYQDARKTAWAGVPPALLDQKGAVSPEVAEQLARGIRERLGARFGLGVTGYAGPGGGTQEAPVGTVFVSFADERGAVVERHTFGNDRERVRTFASYAALDLLRRRGFDSEPS